jgi:flavin reductase (DIM6/NTAB) family NADH-FMN oxidoreductase RutF
MINHDPPLFTIGFVGSLDKPRETARNLIETKECVINIISEGFVETANSCSVDAPYGVSEWDVSGLTPVYDCRDVRCARVKEAVFSIEGKLDFYREYDSRASGKKTGCLIVIEGTRFWVREDAINEDKSMVDTAVCNPLHFFNVCTVGFTDAAAGPQTH